MEKRKISVIIPCFNESKTILVNIKKINEYLFDRFFDYEIIAVNDGSKDKTGEELLKAKESVSKLIVIDNAENFGKGKAVKDGIMASSGEMVMFLDADMAIPIEEAEKFIAEINKGFDIVIASRFIPGLKILKPVLWYRRFMEKAFRILRMIIISNYEISDTQCGFKFFSREAAKNIFPLMTINRFAFDAEIIFIAAKKGYKIKEMPISLQNPANSSVRIYRDSANMLADLIRIRINSSKGKY